MDGDAYEYLETAKAPFPIEDVQQVVKAGTKLVGKYEDVRMAARHAKGIYMRPIAPQAHNARTFLRGNPELGGGISRLREIGAMSHYGGSPPEGVRTPGLPYDDSKTSVMVGKFGKMCKRGNHSGACECNESGNSIDCDADCYGHRKYYRI